MTRVEVFLGKETNIKHEGGGLAGFLAEEGSSVTLYRE